MGGWIWIWMDGYRWVDMDRWMDIFGATFFWRDFFWRDFFWRDFFLARLFFCIWMLAFSLVIHFFIIGHLFLIMGHINMWDEWSATERRSPELEPPGGAIGQRGPSKPGSPFIY